MKAAKLRLIFSLIASQALWGPVAAATKHSQETNRGGTVRALSSESRATGAIEKASLAGYCLDSNRTQLHTARDFAFNHLGYGNRQSLEWARQYNRTHQCKTIGTYVQRYHSLYRFAFDQFLMSFDQAKEFALARVETHTLVMIERMKVKYLAIFRLTNHTMGFRAERSQDISMKWLARLECEGPRGLARISQTYERHLEYASETMNLSSAEAKTYARRKIRNMSICSDLLDRARF